MHQIQEPRYPLNFIDHYPFFFSGKLVNPFFQFRGITGKSVFFLRIEQIDKVCNFRRKYLVK